MRRLRVFALVALASGCSAVVGTGNLASGDARGSDAGATGWAPPDPTPPPDPNAPPTACGGADLATDALNCGRCGHDCLGGACEAGQCQPVKLGTVPSGEFVYISVSDEFVFASSSPNGVDEGRIWRVPKSGGTPLGVVQSRTASATAVVGSTLYFANGLSEVPASPADAAGGLYSCDVAAAPCEPLKLAPVNYPEQVAVAGEKIYFSQSDPPAIFIHTPGGETSPHRSIAPRRLWVDDDGGLWYLVLLGLATTDVVRALHWAADASSATTVTELEFDKQTRPGRVVGNADSVFVSAYANTGSVAGRVRRISRTGLFAPCDYGGTNNRRPDGLHLDAKNVYWANRGNFAEPWASGSIAYCPIDECCDTPTVLAAQTGEPSALTGDDKALYWTTFRTGQIWKVAKP